MNKDYINGTISGLRRADKFAVLFYQPLNRSVKQK